MVWILIGLIGLTYLINKWTLFYGFNDLFYRMEIEKNQAEIGEEIQIYSIVENRKRMTVPFLKINERFPKGFNIWDNRYALFIMPNQRVRRGYKIIGGKRGLYTIEYVYLELGDFIGFKSKRQYMKVNKEIVILPEKVDLYKSLEPIGALNGNISVRRWILDDPLMTIGIREYTGNEPERFIHWPSSIKYNNIMVKNFDFTTDNSIIVVLNIETMKPSWQPIEEDIIERAISLTRAVMEECENLKIPYGFASNAHNSKSIHERGYFYHPGLGQNHLSSFLEILGRMDYKVDTFFENTLRNMAKRQGHYTTVVIITPRILDTYIEPINSLSQTVNRTVIISVEPEHLDDFNDNIIKYRSR